MVKRKEKFGKSIKIRHFDVHFHRLHLCEVGMAKWREKARLNLLRLSHESHDYLISAKEWEFNGNIIDHGNSNNRCELCEGENLRHHFQIENSKNKTQIWVGSSCIHKFDILVRDDDGVVIQDFEGKKKYLNRKLSDKKREIFLNTLRSLWKEVNDYEKTVIRKVGECFKNKETVDPTVAIDLLKILDNYNLDIDTSQIKVSVNSYYCIDLIVRQPDEDRKLLYRILNPNHIDKIERKIQKINLEEEQRERHDAFLDLQAQARAKERANAQKACRPEYKREDIFIMPEFITCSKCGKYTRDWVSMNPDICRDCVRK